MNFISLHTECVCVAKAVTSLGIEDEAIGWFWLHVKNLVGSLSSIMDTLVNLQMAAVKFIHTRA